MKSLPFKDWLNALKTASTFDLYRLSVLINDELDNPQRHMQLLASIHVGQQLHYYDARTHQQNPCRIEQILQKYIVILDLKEQRRYKIQPYMLNLNGKSVDIHLQQGEKFERHHLQVGERIAFVATEQGYTEGNIIRLNQKTVTLRADNGKEWRVSYGLLLKPLLDL
jgi:D-hexose-6-phosphate mutarotase